MDFGSDRTALHNKTQIFCQPSQARKLRAIGPTPPALPPPALGIAFPGSKGAKPSRMVAIP
ncbi:MAG: hypothetical protein EAZ60_20080 [Oscillatoriales cyanobacterium]|nr:MAG: hypothetical protein EAZ79_02925 [Oscillatoriales cyanobacterium]TAF53481.1 MAG: hypothetical protein EAZ60_20080 [Oscillatoriales cyanobacterium]